MHRRAMKYRRIVLHSLFPVLRQFPADTAARMVSRIGQLEYALVPSLRQRFHQTLNRVAEHLQADWDIDQVGRELAGNQVRWRARDILLDGRGQDAIDRVIHAEGVEHLQKAYDDQRGVILLGNHFGAHLMPAHWAVRKGYPLRLFMERPHHVSRILSSEFDTDGPMGQRDLFISRKADPADSARSVMRAARVLKAGYMIFIAGDVRWTDKHTVAIDFLGRPYRISTTWVALAALSGAAVVPTFCRMNRDGTHDLSFLPPYHVAARAMTQGHAGPLVHRLFAEIERRIKIDPASSNDYFFWSEHDDPAYARNRLSDWPPANLPDEGRYAA